MGLPLSEAVAARRSKSSAVIQIVMNGGASHLDTFDPKPEAPREIRGPIHSIATSIPGVHFSEAIPKLAQRANEMVILRSLYHDAAPIHETGLQLLLTGRLTNRQTVQPNIGTVFNRLVKPRGQAPVSVRLAENALDVVSNRRHGTGAGYLGETATDCELATIESLAADGFEIPLFQQSASAKTQRDYGQNHHGELLWSAVRMVESGARYVEVHTFSNLEGEKTWDAHGCTTTAPATIFDYRDTLGPQFDAAVSAMFDDLQSSGLWNQTLVVCSGEMGRTPKINEQLGRDHWPNVWSGFLAGGGLEGGQVIGSSDANGEDVADDPIPVSHLPGLVCRYLGIDSEHEFQFGQHTWTPPSVRI